MVLYIYTHIIVIRQCFFLFLSYQFVSAADTLINVCPTVGRNELDIKECVRLENTLKVYFQGFPKFALRI